MILKPTYPWEMHGDLPGRHVNVNEGPEVLLHGDKIFIVFSASGCFIAAAVRLPTRLAVDRNFGPFSNLGADVELLTLERESPSLWRFPLPEHQPIDQKRMVVLPSPLNRVDPAIGWLSLSIQSIKSDRAGKSGTRFGCISGVYLYVIVWLRISQNQRQRFQV
jgi:hypothetical protein